MTHLFLKSRLLLMVGLIAALAAPMAFAQPAAEATAEKPAAADAKKDVPAGKRVFYASHSLMWEVPAPLTEAVKAYGIEGHEVVGVQSIGFSRVIQHWDQGGGNNQARKALETGDVDVFVMSAIDLPDPGIDNFVKLGLEHNPDTDFLFQVSWGGFNQDGQLARQVMGRGFPQVDWNDKSVEDLDKLNTNNEKAIEAQADEINKEAGKTVLRLIPISQALTDLRKQVVRGEFEGLTQQSQLFGDFIGHPTPVLVTLNMYCHFATIYGRSPVGLPMPEILKRANKPEWDEDFNRRLQELAWKTVINYPHSGVTAEGIKTASASN